MKLSQLFHEVGMLKPLYPDYMNSPVRISIKGHYFNPFTIIQGNKNKNKNFTFIYKSKDKESVKAITIDELYKKILSIYSEENLDKEVLIKDFYKKENEKDLLLKNFFIDSESEIWKLETN